MNHSNLEKIEEIKLILEEVKEKGDLLGIIYATRDGSLIFENIGNDFDGKKFSSMCASVLESATGLGQTIGNSKVSKIITELEEKTIIIVEVDDRTFLTLVAKAESQVNLILDHLPDFSKKLTALN